MEAPPRVSPKDSASKTPMEYETILRGPSSASKRKRDVSNTTVYGKDVDQQNTRDHDAHTPKRTRHLPHPNDAETSDDPVSTGERNVRRKKGFRNLSNLSLHHATNKESQQKGRTRESKFQEGSLTDKPSEKPPSAYTRIIRTDSVPAAQDVDVLMEDYHRIAQGDPDASAQRETAATPRVESARTNEGGGFFHFGRNWASSFHPVTLWNRMWTESKDEPPKEDVNAAEYKVRQKAEAEAKYAEMKQAGLLKLQPVGPSLSESLASAMQLVTPRDSGVSMDESTRGSGDHLRSTSVASDFSDFNNAPTVENPDTAGKTLKGFRSRLHIKKPSLNDIRGGLKRLGSEINLSALARDREHDSSASASPVKSGHEDSVLRRTQSRYDLKKQRKLTKRVSDLEAKLHRARLELDEALVEASPMPASGKKSENVVPSGTLKQQKYTPSKLPSLPSERILMAGEVAATELPLTVATDAARESSPVDLTEFGHRSDQDQHEDELTIKARDHKSKPTVSSLFATASDHRSEDPSTLEVEVPEVHETQNSPQPKSAERMDPNSIVDNIHGEGEDEGQAEENGPSQITQPKGDYATLDAKLKALEQNTKVAKKAKQPAKKRKSGNAEDDKAYKPGATNDDDAEWDEAGDPPKRKRKSTGAKKNGKTEAIDGVDTRPEETSPKKLKSKKKKKRVKTTIDEPSCPSKQDDAEKSIKKKVIGVEKSAPAVPEAVSNNAVANEAIQRSSLESQPLEPLIEEAEEPTTGTATSTTITKIPIKDTPSKPSAKATPARHSRGLHTHSASEQQKSRGNGKPNNNLMDLQFSSDDVDEEPITLVPGTNGIPHLPKGATGSFESLDETERMGMEVEVLEGSKHANGGAKNWEWPDDVF